MKRAMRRRKTWQRQTAAITAAMMAMSVGGIAYAMPQGEVVRSGKGEITRQDKDMTVNQDSKRLAIDWAGFDIANDERVTFRQPDRDSVALNRVIGDAASVIDGALSGNGHVYVINPNGVLFGKNASVDVSSLVASTARISDRDMTNFAGADGITMAIPEDSSAKVINAGTIRAEGGLVVLHAAEVENSGTITNPAGTTALAAARNLSLSADTAGKINFTVDGALAKAKALNSGMLKADGGYLVMTARSAGDVMSTVVNNTGTMEAKTLRQNEKGEILLDGGDNGVVELSGTIDASGMEAGQSAGSIKAIGAETHVKDGATLHATGAVDGGLIETSGDYLEIGDNVDIDAAGKTGKAGEWLLDPTAVIINDSGTGEVNGGSTTYLKTSTIADVLRKNNVTIQATDPTYHNADISLESALNVDETTPGKNTLTLEAEENININADINATAALNVVLNADTNGDDKGGVNINADIHTGGGSLTTGANGATFFGGTKSGENNRAIETSGGNVNIQNEARLQLNGGTLSVNTAGGSVTFARNVASMNKYEAFMDHDFVAYYSQDYPRGKLSAEGQAWEDMIKSVYKQSYTDADGQQVKFVIQGRDYWGRVYDKAYEDLSNSEKLMLSNKLAQIWELANLAATQKNSDSDPDGKNLNGKHLVTITDKYENSAAMANAVKKTGNVVEYFTGGKDVTGRTGETAHRTDGRTFAWVTGPEAGTAFYETTGEGRGYELNGNYTNWVRNEPIDPSNPRKGYYNEPNNNRGSEHQPYVAIGWTDQNGWDDVGNGAGTVHGFIRETELPNSALAINSGAGNVTVGTEGVADTGRLGSGEGTGLRNLSIKTTTGDVKVLGSIYVHDNNANAAENPANGNVEIATQGNVDVGQITADKKVEIATTGADKYVTVNGKIATNGLVSIEATDDITVHGIETGDKIHLISTDSTGDGAITLANNAEGGGALITTSDANDAVIIDARGADGSFKNLTTAEKAIDTDGNWKVYSASPDRDTFSTNLNSNTTARWHANSDGANDLDEYAATNDGNKYIFQVQPTVTVKADDQSKIYGDTADVTKYTTTATASFTGRNGEYSVSDARFTPAFQEGTLKDRYTGEIELSSEGVAEEKTRMDGDIDRTSSDNARPYFVINAEGENLAGKEGYAVTTADGTLEILRRDANISGTGTQTYGKSDISWTTTASNLKNNDQVGTVTIKEGSAYTEIQKGRTTADAGMYENSVAFGSILNEKGEDASINYNLTGTGTIKVDPATLTVYTKDIHKTYSDVDGVRNALLNDYYVKGEANGDSNPALRDSVTLTNTSNAIVKKNGVDRTADASTEGYAINTTDASTSNGNYRLVLGDAGKVYIDKANLTITTNGFEKVYGDVDGVQKALENAATITGLTNGDGESTITVNGKSYALITVDDGTTRTNNVIYNGDTKEYSGYDVNADLSTLSDELRDSIAKNYTIDSKTSTVGKGILKKKGVTLITSDIPTTYGQGNVIHDKLNTNLVDVDGLISWDKDRKEEIKTQLGVTVELTSRSPYKMVDGEPATDSEGNLYTNNVGSYSIITGYTPSGAQWSSTENPNNYEVTSAPVGLVRINPADLTVNVGNATTVYGTPFDTSKYTYSYENLVNGDTAAVVDADLKMSPKYTNTGDGTDGRATQDVGDYSLTIKPSSFNSYLKNYNVTNVLSGVSTVTRAPYTITVGNIEATYGDYKTLFTKLKKNPVGTISGLTNGDQNKFDSTFTGTSEALHFDGKKWSTNNVNTDGYAIDPVIVPELQAALEKNYELVLKDSGRVYLDKAKLQVNIGNAETVYGTPFDKNQYNYNYSTETGKSLVNGDTKESLAQGLGEIKYDNKAALDGTTTGRWTEDVGYDYPLTFTDETKGAFNALNNYNVSFVGGKASVTPAPLKVNREGYTTEYGTVLLEDAAHRFTTWDTLVNGDVDDIKVDNKDYGGAYLDGNTRTNNASDTPYTFKEALTSDSNVLRNYTLDDTGMNSVTITPHTITSDDIVNGNPTFETVYGTTDKKLDVVINGVNGDSDIANTSTTTAYIYDEATGKASKTANVGNDYSITTVLNNTNYRFDNGTNTKLFEKSAKVTPATLKVTRNGYTTEYGTVLLEDAAHRFTTWGTLANGDVDDIKVDNKDYGGAYLDGNTRTNNASDTPYTFKEALTSDSNVLRNYTLDDTGMNSVTITPHTITSDDIVNGNPTFETVYGTTDKKLDVVINGVNGDSDIANTSTTTAYIYDEATGKASKTANVGNDYSITTVLNNTNYRFDNGTNTKLFEKSAKVTPATLKVTRNGYTTEYGTVLLEDAAHRFTTWGTLANGDVDDIKVDNKDYGGAYLDGNTRTNNASDTPYTFKEALTSDSNVLRNYTLDDTGTNSVTITPHTITSDDIVNGNPTFETVYGTTDKKLDVVINGVNGDSDIANTSTTTAYIYDEATGKASKTANVGNDYSITTVLNNTNYRFDNGTNTKLFEKSAKVTPAMLKVTRNGYTTEYGTVLLEDAAHRFTTWGTLANGDVDDIKVDNKDYGGAYLDGNTRTNNASDTPYTFKEALTSDSNVLRNYTLDDTGTNSVTITPHTITSDDIVNGNPTFETVYGTTDKKLDVVINGVNGDSDIANTSTTTAYIYDEATGKASKTANVGNDYSITTVLNNTNYRFDNGTNTKLFEKSAKVTPATLKVTRNGYTTEYGTVLLEDAAHRFTTWGTLANGDVDDIKVDNKDYGGAYLDGNTRTNNASDTPYTFKEALTSDSNVLRNYTLDDTGTNSVTITPHTITSNDIVNGNPTFETVYGTTDKKLDVVINGVNGDGNIANTSTTTAYIYDEATGKASKTANVGNDYSITTVLNNTNYRFDNGTNTKLFERSAKVTPATLKVTRNGYTTEYGTVLLEDAAHRFTTWGTLANGDVDDIKVDNKDYGGAYLDGNTRTNDASDTPYTFKEALTSDSNVLRNYTLDDTGMNSVTITPHTITSDDIVNGNPTFETVYGTTDKKLDVVINGVNGDGNIANTSTTTAYIYDEATGKASKTANVGNDYSITSVLNNKNYRFDNGSATKTFEKSAKVTEAELKIKTENVETKYGTVKTTTSTVDGLVNGDLPTGFIYDYGDYGGAYLDGNTKTNDVNTYHFGTDLSGADFLNNYTITGGGADVKIDPKDVTFFVSGTGNTLADVTYTVDPDIDAQLAYGEHVDADYTPGNDLGSNQYGVVAHINGTPIVTGDVAGNYRYNYGGLITLSPTVPTKPDIDPHNPSNVDGSGSWTSNMGNHGVPGVERVAGLASAELPFFKVEAGQVTHYGTYDVAADPDKVRLEPTGKRLPEPNQPKTQYREYTKALTTTDGTGMFRMIYDGSVFRITPTDDAALALVRTGHAKNNVELSAEALHAGFSEMGILLEDLDGVYVHFENLH